MVRTLDRTCFLIHSKTPRSRPAAGTYWAFMFVHLHVHSNFSFCRGAGRIEELVEPRWRAACGDGPDRHERPVRPGLVPPERRRTGLRPIVGCGVADGHGTSSPPGAQPRRVYHAVPAHLPPPPRSGIPPAQRPCSKTASTWSSSATPAAAASARPPERHRRALCGAERSGRRAAAARFFPP